MLQAKRQCTEDVDVLEPLIIEPRDSDLRIRVAHSTKPISPPSTDLEMKRSERIPITVDMGRPSVTSSGASIPSRAGNAGSAGSAAIDSETMANRVVSSARRLTSRKSKHKKRRSSGLAGPWSNNSSLRDQLPPPLVRSFEQRSHEKTLSEALAHAQSATVAPLNGSRWFYNDDSAYSDDGYLQDEEDPDLRQENDRRYIFEPQSRRNRRSAKERQAQAQTSEAANRLFRTPWMADKSCTPHTQSHVHESAVSAASPSVTRVNIQVPGQKSAFRPLVRATPGRAYTHVRIAWQMYFDTVRRKDENEAALAAAEAARKKQRRIDEAARIREILVKSVVPPAGSGAAITDGESIVDQRLVAAIQDKVQRTPVVNGGDVTADIATSGSINTGKIGLLTGCEGGVLSSNPSATLSAAEMAASTRISRNTDSGKCDETAKATQNVPEFKRHIYASEETKNSHSNTHFPAPNGQSQLHTVNLSGFNNYLQTGAYSVASAMNDDGGVAQGKNDEFAAGSGALKLHNDVEEKVDVVTP